MIATTLSRHHCHVFEHAHNEQKLDLVLVLVRDQHTETYSLVFARVIAAKTNILRNKSALGMGICTTFTSFQSLSPRKRGFLHETGFSLSHINVYNALFPAVMYTGLLATRPCNSVVKYFAYFVAVLCYLS